MTESCLLLIARTGDAAIKALRQHARRRLVHADIDDLLHAGWRYVGGHPDQATAFASGRVIAANRIGAVLCRIRAVAPHELQRLHPDDREYAAAEINAFLRAWLSQFKGVRFNLPSWMSLAGHGWHSLKWAHLAAKAGVPVQNSSPPSHAAHAQRDAVTMTVVGRTVIGSRDSTLKDYALRIAHAVQSNLLAVHFERHDGWKFISADPVHDLNPASSMALLKQAFANDRPRAARSRA